VVSLAGEEFRLSELKECAAGEWVDGAGDICPVLSSSLSINSGKDSKSEPSSGIKGAPGMDGELLISDKRVRALRFSLVYLPASPANVGNVTVSSDDMGELGGTTGVDGALGDALETPLKGVIGVFEGAAALDELMLFVGEGCCSWALGACIKYRSAIIDSRSSSSIAIVIPAIAMRCELVQYSDEGGLWKRPDGESGIISQDIRFLRRRALPFSL